MKLLVTRYIHEPPALSIEAETDYEAAVLARYWVQAKLDKGKGHGVDGFSYIIRFMEVPE